MEEHGKFVAYTSLAFLEENYNIKFCSAKKSKQPRPPMFYCRKCSFTHYQSSEMIAHYKSEHKDWSWVKEFLRFSSITLSLVFYVGTAVWKSFPWTSTTSPKPTHIEELVTYVNFFLQKYVIFDKLYSESIATDVEDYLYLLAKFYRVFSISAVTRVLLINLKKSKVVVHKWRHVIFDPTRISFLYHAI